MRIGPDSDQKCPCDTGIRMVLPATCVLYVSRIRQRITFIICSRYRLLSLPLSSLVNEVHCQNEEECSYFHISKNEKCRAKLRDLSPLENV